MSKDSKVESEPLGTEIEYDMEALRSKAKMFGIDFHPKIGGKKLKEKIDSHIREIELSDVIKESSVGTATAGPNNRIREAELAARAESLVIISDLDIRDADNPTIVMGVMNSFFKIGPVIIKKDEEQLVPKAIIEALKVKTMIKMIPSINNITKRPTGNKVPVTRNRYTVQFIKD